MIIYFYLLIALKILTIESSSIRDRTLKNDLVSFLSSRADLGRKDTNSLKIVSQEPFIIQLGVSNDSGNVNTKDDIKERKRKRPAKKRFSKLRSLRKKHRIRREVKASDYKRISNDDILKPNQTEKLMTDEAAKDLLVNITSKQLAQDNSIKRQEMFQALTQVINETQQELDRRDSDLDKQLYEWIKALVDRKQVKAELIKPQNHGDKSLSTSSSSQSSHQHQPSPVVGMVHQLPRKTDKNQPKYTYKDLMTDRDRLEQKIKYLKNYMSSNDSKMADDGTRVRRKSESDKVNKMAKMFLTLSAVNGMNDRKKFKCKEEEDDYDGDFWSEERRNSPMRRASSTNEERYKVKKWIEHLKSKRSSRSSCPCQNNGRDDETDIFPLELKLSKGLSSRDYGENSEESSETYRGYSKFLDYPHGKTSRTSFYKPRYSFNNEESDNKLSTLSKRGRRKYDLPLDDLETYRTRAKLILQNAEEILDKIKEEEEKRRTTPGCLASHLKELTSRIQGDPRNSENDLIRVLQKTLGWSPLTNVEEGTNEGSKDNEGGSFPHNKWSILDPYEKAKALTEENTKQLSSYLLRNLGKLGGQTTEQSQPEQVEESKPSEPEADEKTQIFQGQVPQDKDSVLSSDDLRRENVPDSEPNQLGQVTGDVPTMIPENKADLLRVKNLQEPIKDKIKEILEEQGKQIQELAGKQSETEENPDDLRHSLVTLVDYLDRIDENAAANPTPWKQSVGSPEENDKKPTNLEQVEAVRGNEDENPTDANNQDNKSETVESKVNTENDDKPTDPDQEEEETSKLVQAPKKNFMDADTEDSKSGERTQDQVLQEKEALEGGDKRSDLDNDDQVEAVKGDQNDNKDESLSGVNENDKVEAVLGEDNLGKDEKATELTEDDKVEAVEGKSNEEDEDPKDVNENDKVEAVNSKENREKTDDDEVEAIQGKSNEGDENTEDLNQEDKVEAMNSKENTADEDVEAVQGKSNEEDEDPKDLNDDDKVEAVNSTENREKTEDDEVEAVKGKSNEEDGDAEDLNQDDKVEATNSKENTADEDVEAVQGRSNEEDEDSKDVNDDDKVEAVNSKEKSADEEVEAVQGKSNEEEDEDPKDLNDDDKVEAINSKDDGEKTEDDEVEAVKGRSNEEDGDAEDLNQDDKVEAVEGREDTESDEKLTDPNQKLRASKPLKSLKKNFKNVNSDDKTEDYKSGENSQDPVVKQENEEKRSSEDEDPNEKVDFTNKETPKASSIEDEETQQKDAEDDVIGSKNLSKSEEQEDQGEPDVARMSNPEGSETSNLADEDLTVADPNFEESPESKMKAKQNEDEIDETSQDNVAAENPTSNKESDQEDAKDGEQIPEKDFAAAEHHITSQENRSEESDDPLTGKTSNSNEENSEADDRDENDLIASKHLKKANEQDGVSSTETGEELKDDNTDDPLTKEHVSNTQEMIQRDSTESGSSSKETEDDDTQVGSEKVEKLGSTENDESKSLESQGVGNVPDEKDSKTIGVPETDDQIVEAQVDGEDSLRAEGLARVIENILGKEGNIPNQDGDDSKDGMIQSAQTTDENPTEDVVNEQPIQPHDSSTSGEITPLLTYSKQQKEQDADPESSETSDELIESSQHNPELTSRENTKDEEWSIETGSPHHQTSDPSEENISEEPHLAKSINDEDWSPETETPHHQASKSRGPSEEPNLRNTVGEYNSGSEEDLDYENPSDDTLRAANPVHDDEDDDPVDDVKHEDNLKASHSGPKKIKLSVPRSVGDVIKDLNDGKVKYGDDMSSFDPEKIDYFIDKIDKAEQANDKAHEVDCKKECACADEIDTRARKIGRYEIVKDVLHWMKDLQMNRVLSDS